MASWDEIKEIIEKIEAGKLSRSLSIQEEQEGYLIYQPTLTERTGGYLGFLGGISIGIGVAVFTMMFNYLLFVWILHIEF